MYILYRAFTVLSLLLIVSCNSRYDSVDNGFDKICFIYAEVFNNPALKDKSTAAKHDAVSDLFRKHVTDVDAISAFVAVAQASPEDKYDLFKQSAEYSLKREWECGLIKELAD